MAVLLSIKPKYTQKIFSGEKKFEFRKQKPKLPFTRVFIYESSPSQTIVGWFNVSRIHSGTPDEIWNKCKQFSGIDEEKYFEYSQGRRVIFAFEIGQIFQFDAPIDPFRHFSDFKPPQNFSYFNDSETLQKFL
jgi:predicted transcriptional regulator